MSFLTINVDVSDHVATLTLNHPGSRNSLSKATLREMVEALDRLRALDNVRALILTGAGQAFCSGPDLGKIDAVDVDDGISFGERVAATMDSLGLTIDGQSLETVIAMEDRNQTPCVHGDDFREAMTAFIEKRQSNYPRQGRRTPGWPGSRKEGVCRYNFRP